MSFSAPSGSSNSLVNSNSNPNFNQPMMNAPPAAFTSAPKNPSVASPYNSMAPVGSVHQNAHTAQNEPHGARPNLNPNAQVPPSSRSVNGPPMMSNSYSPSAQPSTSLPPHQNSNLPNNPSSGPSGRRQYPRMVRLHTEYSFITVRNLKSRLY